MSNSEDQLLFSELQKGNKKAFEELFRKYYESIAGFVYRYVKDVDMAEEITQDMFIHFWENAKRLQINSSVKSYLFTSARNYSLNLLKKNKIRDKYHQISIINHVDESESPKQEQLKTFSTLLLESLKILPDKCREIFELAKYEGLSYEEIAEFLGISKKTVENQLGIALRKIREWMQPRVHELFE